MKRLQIIFGIIVLAFMAYFAISYNVLKDEVSMLRRQTTQSNIAIDSLLSNSQNFVKISDLRQFEQKMDSSTRKVLNEFKIKPKWVSDVIQTTYIYNNYDTTITNTVLNPITGYYDWKVDRDCINTEGFVIVNPDSVKVGITTQEVNISSVTVKYQKKSEEFKLFGKVLFRYGPKQVLVNAKSDCGEIKQVITEIQK